MLLFVVGFVGAGSGWAPLIVRKIQGRPAWSLCGQEMCSCLPIKTIVETEPDCPLCVSTPEKPPLHASLADNPKRLPRTEKFQAIADASQAGCAGLFLSLILGWRPPESGIASARGRIAIDQDALPGVPTRDLPTPPPRA